ncbi:MAG: TolC family protein [Bacillota bacterium]
MSDSSKYRIDNLANAQVVDLYQTKAALALDVTKLGYQLAEKKYALLTRQNYYDVLKKQRLVNVKKAAVKRAEIQAKMAKDAYEAGFKARDDMMMAQAQLGLMKADLSKAQNDLKLSKIELNKIMGWDSQEEIELVDDFTTNNKVYNLQEGLEQALRKRLEIKKSDMECTVADINMELAKRYTAPNTFDYRQICLDKDNAELGRKQAEEAIKAEVRSSYNTVLATKSMLDYVNNSVIQAAEALKIAEYRYQEGYGMPSSVLKSLNMEDAGGTIFEVMAAQEKLCEIEEKVVEITYGYNLAISKYEVDICADN